MSVSGKDIQSNQPFYRNSNLVDVDLGNDIINLKNKYKKIQESELPRGAETEELDGGNVRNVQAPRLGESIFNNYHLLRIKSVNGENYPITDEESANSEFINRVTADQLINNPRGASIYQPEDFIYSKKYGIIENNRMITLRRFAYPVFDDIFTDFQTEPDIGRLITFSDQETNKLSEILSMTFGLRWKELKSTFEQARMQGDQNGIDGYIKNVLKFVDPKFGQEAARGQNRLNYDPLHDQNKVYGPVDSITEMQIRDVGLNFNQEIKLVFEYEMKSIDGLNQKAVFIDLISNILAVTMNSGKFWGGARYWVGPRPTKYLNNLKFLAPNDFDDFVTGAHKEFKGFIGNLTGQGGGVKSVINTLKTVAQNALNLSLGKMLDKIGRPGIPLMNSLLTGQATGEWHLTIGNPLNPIMVIGDLVLTDTSLSFGDELGFDDFPTTLKLECSLKHNKPRSVPEIENMFNVGKGRTYWKPKDPFKVNGNQSPSDKTRPTPISDLLDANTSKLYGAYQKSDLIRNAEKVWPFKQL